MTKLQARLPIRYQILLLGLIGLVGMLSIVGVNTWSATAIAGLNTSINEIRTAESLENHMRVALLQARRYEKDYLLRPNDQLPQRHAGAISAAETAINALTEPLAEHPAERDQLQQIRRAMQTYVESFDAVQNDVDMVGINENQGLQGQLRGSVHDIETQLDKLDVPAAKIAMLMMRRHEKDFIIRLDPKYGEMLGQRLPEFAAALAAAPLSDDTRSDLTQKMKAYQDTFGRFMRGTLVRNDDAARLDTIFDAMEQRIEALDADFTKLSDDETQAIDEQTEYTRSVVLMSVAATAVLAIGLSWLIGRGIARPITEVTRSMEGLVNGDLDVAIPAAGRRDEIGTMIHAVHAFHQSLINAARARDETAVANDNAEREKRAALIGMAERVEAESAAAVAQIGERTAAMTATASEMRALATRGSQSAEGAAHAAASALSNAQAVASAAEELAASIRQIGVQVDQSTSIVNQAVAAGGETRATIQTLNDRVGQISRIAGMIGEVASKTNLLALNATIEAARAGEAGKGFAVVAGEVKQLATQTARSTDEITHQINEVLAATDAAVTAVARIEATIAEVSAIAGSIADAVGQQAAATAEIARNVTETATAVREMADRNATASKEAEQAGTYAHEMAETTRALDTAIGTLRQVIVHTVRTSTTEVDRRLSARYAINLPCLVAVQDQAPQTARIADISAGGARIVGLGGVAPGMQGTLRFDGHAAPLAFSVLNVVDEAIRVVFQLDQDGAMVLKTQLQEIAGKAAA